MTGAVILAAGSGYDPESFQPMLTVSGTSAVKKQISTLREAGISRFIVVTGYQAEQLEKHLSHRGVTFVRNPDYRTSQMLDSIRYALAAAEDWERALILPVDHSFFPPGDDSTDSGDGGADRAFRAIMDRMAIRLL